MQTISRNDLFPFGFDVRNNNVPATRAKIKNSYKKYKTFFKNENLSTSFLTRPLESRVEVTVFRSIIFENAIQALDRSKKIC